MKKHRINFNLLYDHDPGKFASNIDRILNDVADSELLNIFVMELKYVTAFNILALVFTRSCS